METVAQHPRQANNKQTHHYPINIAMAAPTEMPATPTTPPDVVSTPTPMEVDPVVIPVLGFDIGNQTSVAAVSCGNGKMPVIVSNNLSNQLTPYD